MTWISWMRGSFVTLLTASGFALSGCGYTAGSNQAEETPTAVVDNHDGWWCPEHGVPEEICARCSTNVAADFQLKGDWCEEHSRPDSQCFVCHPELQEKFAAQYAAKFGSSPPKPTE